MCENKKCEACVTKSNLGAVLKKLAFKVQKIRAEVKGLEALITQAQSFDLEGECLSLETPPVVVEGLVDGVAEKDACFVGGLGLMLGYEGYEKKKPPLGGVAKEALRYDDGVTWYMKKSHKQHEFGAD